MAALSPICQASGIQPRLLGGQTSRGRVDWSRIQSVNLTVRWQWSTVMADSASLGTKPLRARRWSMRPATIQCRAAENRGTNSSHCKRVEDSVTTIMKDVIQHCFNKECDGMREKVVNQVGSGLAALVRVYMGVAADSSTAPIPNKFAIIEDGDLEQVRRLLQLTSLPFHNTYEEELKDLMNMLQTGEAGQGRKLTGSELSQICERLGSDMVQCLGPLAMCFPELPLWAKQRTLLLPAEVAGKVALSLLAGPKRR